MISQPMLFPWIGLFEQMRLADIFVWYDDVAFSKGSFQNRVQYKTAQGSRWLTVPVADTFLGQEIRHVAVNNQREWRRKHLQSLGQAYARAAYRDLMLATVEEVYGRAAERLGEIAMRSIQALARRLGLGERRELLASELGIGGRGSERVLAIVKALGGEHYVTGWGARNYLDHDAFERNGVRVFYMDYRRTRYPQLHGAFDPHVSALDALANCGEAAGALVGSGTLHWREFLNGSS